MAFNMHDDMRHVHLKRKPKHFNQSHCGEMRAKSFQYTCLANQIKFTKSNIEIIHLFLLYKSIHTV